MDVDHEMRRAKFAMFIGLLFLVSLVCSCSELRYAVFGKTIDAQVTMAKPTLEARRRGQSVPVLLVEYQFNDNGSMRKEQDVVPRDWPATAGQTTPVQYLSGTDVSRLEGHSNMFWVYVFLTNLVVMGVIGIRFWRFYKS